MPAPKSGSTSSVSFPSLGLNVVQFSRCILSWDASRFHSILCILSDTSSSASLLPLQPSPFFKSFRLLHVTPIKLISLISAFSASLSSSFALAFASAHRTALLYYHIPSPHVNTFFYFLFLR